MDVIMDPTHYDELQRTLEAKGPAEAIDQLCASLRERKDFSSLFYALLMKKRHELGVIPLPTAPSGELPERVHAAYEEAIRQAGRQVGQLFLDQGDIVQAAPFFRMLGEVAPIQAALEKYEPFEGEDTQPIIELAFHHGGHPRRGFDWVLQRHGICSAITMLSGHLQAPEFVHGTEVRDYCIQRLVQSLHEQLSERLRADVVQREGSVAPGLSVPQLIAGRDWIFDEENYHVDVSHLSAVVQMSTHLPACPELQLARDMCAYGEKLSPRFQYRGDPPFEDPYKDYGIFLATVAGERVEEGIAHFRAKVEPESADAGAGNTVPAEVLVNLLLRLNRPVEALAVARRYLETADERQLSCPGVSELCRRVKDYRALAEVSRERDDPVSFVAGLILANGEGAAKG
jgi:hypothetical protein